MCTLPSVKWFVDRWNNKRNALRKPRNTNRATDPRHDTSKADDVTTFERASPYGWNGRTRMFPLVNGGMVPEGSIGGANQHRMGDNRMGIVDVTERTAEAYRGHARLVGYDPDNSKCPLAHVTCVHGSGGFD